MSVHHQIAPCLTLKINCKVLLLTLVGLLKVHLEYNATTCSLFQGAISLAFCQAAELIHPSTKLLSDCQSLTNVQLLAINLLSGCQKASQTVSVTEFCQFGIYIV